MVNRKIYEDYYKVYKSKGCIICGTELKKGFSLFNKVLFDDFSQTSEIYLCKQCGTGYTYPFLTQSKLFKLYNNYVAHDHDDKISRYLWYKIFYFIEDKVMGICLKSNNHNFKKLLTSFIFQRFFQTFPIYTTNKKNTVRILDIGCGNGFFLKLAMNAGCEVYGTEVDKKLVMKLKSYGINAFLNLNIVKKRKIKFDIIRINHVLDHMANPNLILKGVRQLIKKNGEIIIGVPNYATPARVFGKYMFMHIPFHRLHFTSKGIIYLLKNNKYQLRYIRTKSCGVFSWSMLRLFKLSSTGFTVPIKFIEIMSLSQLFDFLKIGDSLEIYATI